MRTHFKTRRSLIAVAVATLFMAVVLPAGVANAGGNGATTGTQHVTGAAADGLVVLDFQPGAPTLPAGCWANPDLGIVSTFGNAVLHFTVNPAQDFWFTTTYEGDAAVYPLALPPTKDSNGNYILNRSGSALYTGHLTTWFGFEGNQYNSVIHATASFHGTNPAGQAVNLNGHFQFATNAQGVPTAQVSSITC